MNIVSFGGGTDSAAMLVGLHRHGVPVDLILFADTGAEQPHTYAFVETMDRWLRAHGMPGITVVENVDRYGDRLTLEMECLRSCTLPSLAYGYKTCSQKHKIGPQDKFCNHHPACRAAWARGEKVIKFIGYDAGEARRRDKAQDRDAKDKKYRKVYPLLEWGWDRDTCIRAVEEAGLPRPGKSSCFFCPSMKKPEVLELRRRYPDLFARALAMEDAARPGLTRIKGLGRRWSWREYAQTIDAQAA